jgi:hypothetical protein
MLKIAIVGTKAAAMNEDIKLYNYEKPYLDHHLLVHRSKSRENRVVDVEFASHKRKVQSTHPLSAMF